MAHLKKHKVLVQMCCSVRCSACCRACLQCALQCVADLSRTRNVLGFSTLEGITLNDMFWSVLHFITLHFVSYLGGCSILSHCIFNTYVGGCYTVLRISEGVTLYNDAS